MVTRKKIDSNETSLNYAEEESIGVLPGSPVFINMEPNSYGDFGGDITLTARNPINSGRQRKKGKPTDLDAKAEGIEQDFTLYNSPDLLQGFMFADTHKKGEALPTGTSAGNYIVAAGKEAGFLTGALLWATDFDTVALNGLKKVTGSSSGLVGVTGLPAVSPDSGKIKVVGFEAAAGEIAVTVSGGTVKLTSSTLDLTMVLRPGQWIFLGGDATGTKFTNAGNNGFKRVRNVVAGSATIDQSDAAMVAEAGTGLTMRIFFGDFLKNEVGDLIKRRSYHLERTLGVPDPSNPSERQAEYVTGAVANMCALDVGTADKITMTLGFMATDSIQVDASEGPISGTRVTVKEADFFNTSSDVALFRMSIVDPATNSPTPLFAYLTDAKITIDNKASTNKAVGVFGAFDVTAGTFTVTMETTAYFIDVAAIAAVRKSRDVQVVLAMAANNEGFVIDIPLITAGGGLLDIKQDEPIMIPLKADASTAAKLAGDLDFTLGWTFFYYLPNAAG